MGPPFWKVKREWDRLCQQLRAIPERWTEPRAQKAHDAAFAKGFPVHSGNIGLDASGGAKIALLLVFQPKQLDDSLRYTCQYLVSQGYAPLIVANDGLSAAARTALLPDVWKILERPNFGYDFGGYRDGLWYIRSQGIPLKRVFVLNDSVWAPLDPDSDMIPRLEALNADVAGIVLRSRGENIKFLESYCYLISQRVLRDAAFWQYWDQLKFTSNKYKVIRRGERGFSHAMRAAGFTLTPLSSQDAFRQILEQLPSEDLHKVLIHSTHHDDRVLDARDAVLAAWPHDGWRNDALAYVDMVLSQGQFYSIFPYGAAKYMNHPVLKKSKDRTAVAWRHAYCGAVQAGALPHPAPVIWAELQR